MGDGGQGGNQPAWAAQLPDDLKTNDILTGFENIGDLGKAYLDLNGKLENAVMLPGEDASDEDRATFYAKLGRPESPDGYELKKPDLPEGIPYDEEREKTFRDVAFKHGFTAQQAAAAYDLYHQMVIRDYEEVEAARKEMREKAETALKAEWGAAFDANLEVSRRAALRFGGDKFKEFLEQSGLGDNPAMVKVFYEIGKQIREDGAGGGGGGGGGEKSAAEVLYPDQAK